MLRIYTFNLALIPLVGIGCRFTNNEHKERRSKKQELPKGSSIQSQNILSHKISSLKSDIFLMVYTCIYIGFYIEEVATNN